MQGGLPVDNMSRNKCNDLMQNCVIMRHGSELPVDIFFSQPHYNTGSHPSLHLQELIGIFCETALQTHVFRFQVLQGIQTAEHLSQQQTAGKAEEKFCLVKGMSRGIMTGTFNRQRACPLICRLIPHHV